MIWKAHYCGIDDKIVEKAKHLLERLGILANNGRFTHAANIIRGHIINDITNASNAKKLADDKKFDIEENEKLNQTYVRILNQLVKTDFEKAIDFLNKNEA